MKKALKEKIALLNKHLSTLADSYEVRKIGIFGSYARGEQKRGSDIDILVDLKKPVGFFAFLDLEKYLERILQAKVDLVTSKALKPSVKKEAMRDIIYVEKH